MFYIFGFYKFKKLNNLRKLKKIFHAKLVENAGFDAVWAGSFAISATHALPDASILTMTEFFNVASTMTNACDIPIIADCDTGYGGPSNVAHMVRKYENAGIASICIEDKIFPKQNSFFYPIIFFNKRIKFSY